VITRHGADSSKTVENTKISFFFAALYFGEDDGRIEEFLGNKDAFK
jgi:hypothetical protein